MKSTKSLCELSEAENILNKQQENGSWKYPNSKEEIRTQDNYNQLETYRQLGFLIEKYGINKQHQVIQKAAEFLFSLQTNEGDFRGIYGNQYSSNYTAGIMELLIKTGNKTVNNLKDLPLSDLSNLSLL